MIKVIFTNNEKYIFSEEELRTNKLKPEHLDDDLYLNTKFGNNSSTLTIGKTYDAIISPILSFCYIVTNDIGKQMNINKRRFISLAKHRENQINEIFKD